MTMQIPLTQGFAATVDDEDAALADLKWFANVYGDGRVYAVRNAPGRGRGLTGMHRFIAGAETGEEVDHINGDTLDNRRSNLRRVTRAENAQNLATRKNSRSGHRGVCQRDRVWEARVQRNGKIVYRACFSSMDDAVRAVRLARKRLLPFDAQGTVGLEDGPAPAAAPSRHNRDKTHCAKGHELSGDNLRVERYGGRRCLTCRRENVSRHVPQKVTGEPWPWNQAAEGRTR